MAWFLVKRNDSFTFTLQSYWTSTIIRHCTEMFIIYPNTSSQGNSVNIETSLRTGPPGFNSRQGQWWIYLFSTASKPALGLTQLPIQWVPEALSPGVKRPGREANHSPPSNGEVKNRWSYTSTPFYIFVAWVFIKQRIRLHGVMLS
jgi:hypothetical protein